MRIPVPLILAAVVVIGSTVTLILVFKLLQTVAVILPGIAPTGADTVTVNLGYAFSETSWGYYLGMGRLTVSHNASSDTVFYVYPDPYMYTFALASYSTPSDYQRIVTDKGVLYLCKEGPYGIAYSPNRLMAFVGKFEYVGGLYVLVPGIANDTLKGCMVYVAQSENHWGISFLWVNGTSFWLPQNSLSVYTKAYYFTSQNPPYPIGVSSVPLFNVANANVLPPDTERIYGGFEHTNVTGVYRLYAVYTFVDRIKGTIRVSITAS